MPSGVENRDHRHHKDHHSRETFPGAAPAAPRETDESQGGRQQTGRSQVGAAVGMHRQPAFARLEPLQRFVALPSRPARWAHRQPARIRYRCCARTACSAGDSEYESWRAPGHGCGGRSISRDARAAARLVRASCSSRRHGGFFFRHNASPIRYHKGRAPCRGEHTMLARTKLAIAVAATQIGDLRAAKPPPRQNTLHHAV